MKVKELNLLRRKMFDEMIKIEEVSNALKNTNQVYVYEFQEGSKHDVVVIEKISHLNGSLLQKLGYTENALISQLYVINKQTKQCI